MRSVSVDLNWLGDFHPGLIWDHIIAATAVIAADRLHWRPCEISFESEGGFESERIAVSLAPDPNREQMMAKARKSLDAAKLVELAAIGYAGLALHYTCAREIVDVTAHGAGADYLVGTERALLEVTGRSRKQDLLAAWNQRRSRLKDSQREFFLFAIEFETPFARLGHVGPRK